MMVQRLIFFEKMQGQPEVVPEGAGGGKGFVLSV